MKRDEFEPFLPNGKNNLKFLGRYSDFYQTDILERPDDFILVGCKHCIGCKLAYGRSWADRMLLELDHSKVACFLTLTYNENNVPLTYGKDGQMYMTLVKKEVQLFNKRLRQRFPDKELRVFYCGEYGDLHGRPHYHEIVFGLDYKDFACERLREDGEKHKYQLLPWSTNDFGQVSFRSDLLEEIWRGERVSKLQTEIKGICTVSESSYKTFAYVARYCMKKVYKDSGSVEQYADKGRLPEFVGMSNRPGIGGYFLKEHDIDADSFAMYDGQESKSIVIPSKLFELNRLTAPELYDKIKEQRKDFAIDNIKGTLMQTDLSYKDYLSISEQNTKAKIKSLKRSEL